MRTSAALEVFMGRALALARSAARKGEVPVGAVLIKEGKVLASGFNLTRSRTDPTAHAEIVAIQKAAAFLKNERFLGTILVVTLEPCAMCAGAIVQARIPVVVYGADDPKAGACGSVFKILPSRKLNHRPIVVKGVRAGESVKMLQQFFRRRRMKAPLR